MTAYNRLNTYRFGIWLYEIHGIVVSYRRCTSNFIYFAWLL